MIVRRAEQRYRTDAEGITTFHSFSFGSHYDRDNVRLGPILALNEELVAPGAGYDPHRHEDVEIVTWVIDGELAHDDSAGGSGAVHAGQLRRVSAGAGFTHAERNGSDASRLRFVQLMLVAGTPVAVEIVAGQREVGGPALLYVAVGTFQLGDATLGPGDQARVDDTGTYSLHGTGSALLVHGWPRPSTAD